MRLAVKPVQQVLAIRVSMIRSYNVLCFVICSIFHQQIIVRLWSVGFCDSRLLAWPGSGTQEIALRQITTSGQEGSRLFGTTPDLSCLAFGFFGTKFCYDGCVRECVVVHGGRPVQFKRNIYNIYIREIKKSRTRSGSPSLSVTVKQRHSPTWTSLPFSFFFSFFLGREPKTFFFFFK
jgi:hypothetical protein